METALNGPQPRTALVTGASRGIGRAIAVALATRGDRVAVHFGRDEQAARETLSLLAGDGHILVGGDLGQPDEVARIAREAITALDGIDLLVNNAAVAPTDANRHVVGEADDGVWVSTWRTMVDVGLLGATHLTHLVTKDMVRRGRQGAVVNVGSRGALRGEPEHPAYAATKAALQAAGQSMALALAPHGISVVSIAPGFVATERQQPRLSGERGDQVRAQSPFGRVGTPEEVAQAVLWLGSPAAQWASGAVLDLNGASYLH